MADSEQDKLNSVGQEGQSLKKKQTVRYRKRRRNKQALKGGFKKIYMVDLSGSCDRQIIFDDIPSELQ